MDLFPQSLKLPEALMKILRVRPTIEIYDFMEQVYQAHWRIRDAALNALPVPDGIDGGVVQEWHLALNWITRYEDEDNRDEITTDT